MGQRGGHRRRQLDVYKRQAHGYASMFANNEMEYDEQTVLSDLGLIFDGAVKALRGGF